MKTELVSPRTDKHIIRVPNQDLNQWLELSKEKFEVQCYDYELVVVKGIQLKVKKIKPALGANTKLTAGSKNKE